MLLTQMAHVNMTTISNKEKFLGFQNELFFPSSVFIGVASFSLAVFVNASYIWTSNVSVLIAASVCSAVNLSAVLVADQVTASFLGYETLLRKLMSRLVNACDHSFNSNEQDGERKPNTKLEEVV